jgi:hypothetical protein
VTDLPVSASVPVGTRYYWNVRACRGSSCSAWGAPSYVDVGRARSDLDGDGYSDLVASQLDYLVWEGGAYVYHGGASGPGASPTYSTTAPQLGAKQYFGAVMSTGDVNGDGFADLAVNAPSWDGGTINFSKVAEGKVYVYYGSSNGIPFNPSVTLNATGTWNPGWSWTFGYAVAAAGDVDADGFADVVLNTVVSGGTAASPGGVFAGSAGGLATAPTYVLPGISGGFVAGEPLARAIATDGDVDGDGIADIVMSLNISQGQSGGALIYRGTSKGSFSAPHLPSGDMPISGTAYARGLVTSADLDGDTIADVLAGEGSLQVFPGHWPSGVWGSGSTLSVSTTDHTFGAWFTTGSFDGAAPQIAVGAFTNPQTTGTGCVYLFHPGSTTPFATINSPTPASGQAFGMAVQQAGDVDGDGYDDLAVGDPYTATGAVYLYKGSAAGLPSTHSASFSNPSGSGYGKANFGHALAQ